MKTTKEVAAFRAATSVAPSGSVFGVLGLTAVEQGMGLNEALPGAFSVMVVSVLVMTTGFAIDTFSTFPKK